MVITGAIRRAKLQSNRHHHPVVKVRGVRRAQSPCSNLSPCNSMSLPPASQNYFNHCHQQTNTQLFTGRMPFLSPNQQCQSIERRKYHIPRICLPQTHLGVFRPCLNGSWLPCERIVKRKVVFEVEASGGSKAGRLPHPSLSPFPPLPFPFPYVFRQTSGREGQI